MIVWAALAVASAILLYMYLNKPHKFWKEQGVPFLPPTFLFGNMLSFFTATKPLQYVLQDVYEKYKNYRYFGMYQFLQPVLIINDLELTKRITVKDFDHFVDHKNHSVDVEPIWSRNIVNMTGEKWRSMRATLSPAFTGSKMRVMFSLIDECVKNAMDNCANEFGKNGVESVELTDLLSRLTNDCIATCAFGIKCNSLVDKDNEFYTQGKCIFRIRGLRLLAFFLYSCYPQVLKWFKISLFPSEMITFFKKAITETIRHREAKQIIRHDLIHLLTEARKGRLVQEEDNAETDSFATAQESDWAKKATKLSTLSDDDIVAQALTFFFAGFEGNSSQSCFVAYELAVNTDVQDRLMAEVDQVWKECNGMLNYEALMKMKYLDMVVSECLRKWPIGTITDRKCTKDYVIHAEKAGEKDVMVKKGQTVWIPIICVHWDEQYFPEPTKFDPERFSQENKKEIDPFRYMPFGTGPRNCLGSRFAIMQIKTVSFHLLRQFRIVPVDKTLIPMELERSTITLNARGGMWLGLQKR